MGLEGYCDSCYDDDRDNECEYCGRWLCDFCYGNICDDMCRECQEKEALK